MWTDEIIFSVGDLCNPEYYLDSLRDREEYTLNLRERQYHLIQIMKRISAEMKLIDKLIDYCSLLSDAEIEAILSTDVEASADYIFDHWEEYCNWCIDHNPDYFPINNGNYPF